MENQFKPYWSTCLSIAAIIFSIVAICVSSPSELKLNIDFSGVTEGILSLLVTILIGWQIYNVIAIDKKIDSKIAQANDSLKTEIGENKKKLIDYIKKENEQNIGSIDIALLVLQADGYLQTELYEHALLCYLSALSKAVDLDLPHNDASLRIDHCLNKVEIALRFVDKNKMKSHGSETILNYMKPLLKIKSDKAINIVKFLNELL